MIRCQDYADAIEEHVFGKFCFPMVPTPVQGTGTNVPPLKLVISWLSQGFRRNLLTLIAVLPKYRVLYQLAIGKRLWALSINHLHGGGTMIRVVAAVVTSSTFMTDS